MVGTCSKQRISRLFHCSAHIWNLHSILRSNSPQFSHLGTKILNLKSVLHALKSVLHALKSALHALY